MASQLNLFTFQGSSLARTALKQLKVIRSYVKTLGCKFPVRYPLVWCFHSFLLWLIARNLEIDAIQDSLSLSSLSFFYSFVSVLTVFELFFLVPTSATLFIRQPTKTNATFSCFFIVLFTCGWTAVSKSYVRNVCFSCYIMLAFSRHW